jgi:phospholipid transport system substrate-binding protein
VAARALHPGAEAAGQPILQAARHRGASARDRVPAGAGVPARPSMLQCAANAGRGAVSVIGRWGAWVALALALGSVAPAIADDGGGAPAQVVDRLHDALLAVLKESAELGYEQRFARLAPVVDATFDLPFMAEKAVGRQWRTLAPADRTRWLECFARFTAANYAGRFVGYTGQTFETLGGEPGANETTIVRTRLLNPSDKNVDLNYRIYLDGTVSELALRRTEYSSVLKRDGFEKLVALLDAKVADLAAAKPAR